MVPFLPSYAELLKVWTLICSVLGRLSFFGTPPRMDFSQSSLIRKCDIYCRRAIYIKQISYCISCYFLHMLLPYCEQRKRKHYSNAFWDESSTFQKQRKCRKYFSLLREKRKKDTCITFFNCFSFIVTIFSFYKFLFSISLFYSLLISYYLFPDLIQQTDWHRIAVFKPYLRETVYRYLTKGQRVLVQGRLGYLERRDPENNSIVMKSATIVADDVVFFNKGEGNTGIYQYL